jgi:hypothetical protein
VLLVVIDSKFTHGAWLIILLIPLLVGMFRAVHYRYRDMRQQIALERPLLEHSMQFSATRQFKVVVPVSNLNRASLHAVQFARSLSRDVTAVIVDIDPQATARVEENWQAWNLKVPLVVLKSLYRWW